MNEVPHTIKTDVKPTIINLPKEEGIFNNAINTINTEIPPITKLYAAGEYTELYQSIIQYSKISFLLLFWNYTKP